MQKPASLFDRDWEWATLTNFVTDPAEHATLGIVSGRRRQGKTLLLQELCAEADGFYFAATEATAAESLALLSKAYAEHSGLPAAPSFHSWEQAIDALLALGENRRIPVVLDEFPYLCRASPALPSIIQKALAPRRRQRLNSQTRLILCGSAITFMGKLLSGSAPLRGRAGLDLTVPTFDPRTAAEFWGIDDWALALRVNAVVGGTPAYRREYVRDDAPSNLADFDSWVCRTVLDPASPLSREARYLLAEESDIRDPALYHSVLAAVANGKLTRGAIASYVGKASDTLRHPITVLEDAGFLVREHDALRKTRTRYRVSEPLITFYNVIMRPEWSRLARPGNARTVWGDSTERFHAQVLGAHFEEMCRWWTSTHASTHTLGGPPATVVSGTINDAQNRSVNEIDVVASDRDGRILAIGEAKAGKAMGITDLERLRRIRHLLATHGHAVESTRLLCFSAAGFTDDLLTSNDATLVDLERIYTGS